MSVQEFCVQILSSGRLDEKLMPPPADLIDDASSNASLRRRSWALELAEPVRVESQRFCRELRERQGFPKASELRSAEGRARALHFFANHELLALEVLAWALLAFPDAPPLVRADWLATLADEQVHFALYCDRIHELGLEFGALGLNDTIWRRARDHRTPRAFTACFSLAFEGANLDFAAEFAERFERSGDASSAKLMRRVLADEIVHVRRGVQAFAEPAESFFDAFERELCFPMAASRSRGPRLHERSRRAAGFPDSALARLQVTARTRGADKPEPSGSSASPSKKKGEDT